jgi:hypothetical protein
MIEIRLKAVALAPVLAGLVVGELQDLDEPEGGSQAMQEPRWR